MNLNETIQEYKNLTEVHMNTDYADRKSVKANNQAVDRMYEIVNSLLEKFGENGLLEFEKLLSVEKNKTNLWAAIHLLEKITLNKETENKALEIIRQASNENSVQALGLQYWLKNWEKKN